MRSVIKQAEQGRKIVNGHTDMTMRELMQVFDETEKEPKLTDKIFTAAWLSFYMGVAVGYKAGKSK